MAHVETVSTSRAKQIVDITDHVERVLAHNKAETGLCHVFCMHTTSAVTTADLDPGTDLDMLDAFEAIVPKLKYRHPHNPAHVPDHIMSTIIGPGVIVPVHDGELKLGTWQRIVLVELDGPRKRNIAVSFLPSAF
ncbi:MAG: secondary thiamine-phosphate synthase enzyme YjbQ [Terriglobales bacterium]